MVSHVGAGTRARPVLGKLDALLNAALWTGVAIGAATPAVESITRAYGLSIEHWLARWWAPSIGLVETHWCVGGDPEQAT